jgi:hypothetical protein
MDQTTEAILGRPCIESVSDDGEVEVTLANGRRSVIHVPIEQVEQLRRVAFMDGQRRAPNYQYAFEG